MSDFITPSEVGLDINNFDVEIIEIGNDYYDNYTPFAPRQKTKVRVNADIFIMDTSFNDELLIALGRDPNIEWKTEIIKFEAVLKHINKSPQYLRKLKLEKIKEIYGD